MTEKDKPVVMGVRRERCLGVVAPCDGWFLKVFVVSIDECAPSDIDEAIMAIGRMVTSLETRLSPEFAYGRFGFAVVHFGRRGTSIAVTHFGLWGDTFEVFSSAWYRYAELGSEFCLLDDVEPALSSHEVGRTVVEIGRAVSLAVGRAIEDVRADYLSSA